MDGIINSMILDNKNENKKVFEWIEGYAKHGDIDVR